MVKLQVALDLRDLNKAVKIAHEVIENGADIIEIGTPLIKEFGSEAIKRIRKEFPKITILADMKTMDAGFLESQIAFEAGADLTVVLALADDSTILEAKRAAKEYNGSIVIDLINTPNPVKRALEIYSLGVMNFCFHIGVDVQKRRRASILELLNDIKSFKRKAKEGKVFIAGGIRIEMLNTILNYPIDVIVVGKAITGASNPGEVARKFKEIIKLN